MTQKIPISQLKVGMVIIKVTAQNGPVKIRKSGVVSSEDMIRALTEMGVQQVEIDPDMTVEVSPPQIAKSKTQQLLEDTTRINQSIDHSISEQFNRSLFLPSVQELPEAWQYYGKKAAILAVVVSGGLCLGFLGAKAASWHLHSNAVALTGVTETTPVKASAKPSASNEQGMDVGPTQSAEQAVINQQTEMPVAANPAPSALTSDLSTEPDNDMAVAEPAQPSTPVEPEQVEEVIPPKQPQVDIPPELVKRFQDVLQAMGDSEVPDPVAQVQPKRDVPSIQDLPAWAQTQLPSMSFSAHMYVSAPAQRWVRVNGKQVFEGQEIEQGLRVTGIEPQHVILTFRGQEFSMEALSDW